MLSSAIFAQLMAKATSSGELSYFDYVQTALYADGIGYYSQQRKRVGRHREADFYTAVSLGQVFYELVLASAQSLLGPALLSDYTFVELGAEPGQSAATPLTTLCKDYLPIRLGDSIAIPAKAIVFANELLDAQPFHRLRFSQGRWRELGVRVTANTLTEIQLEQPTTAVAQKQQQLPTTAPEGYTIDWPLGAEKLLQELITPPWQGLLLLFDYGKTWQEITQSCPAGTARCYTHHQQHNNLLAKPGEQDITCHICWDPLMAQLSKAGFQAIALERQEAFFVHHAQTKLQSLFTHAADTFNPNRQTALQLLHPSSMGHAFQVLHAKRLA